MEAVNIHTHGFILNENIRKFTIQRLNSVFGFDAYKVQKIKIDLSAENSSLNEIEKCCYLEIKVHQLPTITTEYKSEAIFTAINLAIEHAHLILSRQLKRRKSQNTALQFKLI